ncbi:hypothetical protein DX933_12635 [Ornithinibacillus gellani]|uniref:hypothetical protein n=1 Tax=Ornithinibacillus gellani TaxID=2293253 RepID=UPI000F4ABA56|nr:hypothetical protein [Ornithinibacillus gellani]TQS74167.1 hypothetical protein DX933_12635 [Ornithinibacillus gellani]
MNKWFYFNFILLFLAIWKVAGRNPATDMQVYIGLAGLCFFLFNWTRHAVFSTIRTAANRQTKIKLANISKKILPFHRWIGTTALIIIFIHAFYAIRLFGFNLTYPKLTSGLIVGLALLAMVITGWWRLYWPGGKVRQAHIYIGISIFFLALLHILL